MPAYPGLSDRVNWQPSGFADFGVNPAVAEGSVQTSTTNGFFNNSTAVVLAHHQQAGLGPLYYRVGFPTGSTIAWGSDHTYDYGMNPSVAISAGSNYVVEVHDGTAGVGPLWYRVGYVVPGTGKTIYWSNSHPLDPSASGIDPSVAMEGNTVVEVNAVNSGAGPLVSRVGTLNPSNLTVSWGSSSTYDSYGADPSVAYLGTEQVGASYVPEFKEVHQGGLGFGPLWTRTGTIVGSNSYVSWSSSTEYDSGVLPRIAGSTLNCGTYVEVHQGQPAFGPLWYHASTTNCVPPPPAAQ